MPFNSLFMKQPNPQDDIRNTAFQNQAPVIAGIVSEVEKTTDCADCGLPFKHAVLVVGERIIADIKRCPGCLSAWSNQTNESRAKTAEKDRKARMDASWEVVCPPSYYRTSIGRLMGERKISEEIIKRVANRPFSERGLGLVGGSRKGKTRLIFCLLRRYHIEEGHEVVYVRSADFADELAALYGESNGAGKANTYIKKFMTAPVLFIDDIGKEKLTARSESAFWRVIEYRSIYDLPIFFTANSGGDDMIAKMESEVGDNSDRAIPIVLRLREFCDAISV